VGVGEDTRGGCPQPTETVTAPRQDARISERIFTLRYCEGYGMNRNFQVLFPHAWALDPNNNVIDITAADDKTGEPTGERYEYFGVAFERRQ
jgi:hypothetical protein